MPLRHVQKVTAYITAALGLSLLALSGELTLTGTAITIIAFIISWWAEEPRITSQKWNHAWNIITILVLMVQFFRWWTGAGFITVAVQFAAFLQINKLFNRKNQTDYDHILILSLVHLMGSSILFSSIGYAIIFVFYIIVIPWFIMVGQIRREVELKYLEKKDAESIYNFKRVLRSKRLINGKILAGMAILSIPVFILTAIIFLFFPRIGFGLLSGNSLLSRKTAGFSDVITIGDLVPIADNPMSVARVEFDKTVPEKESMNKIHWRATAYDFYDGSKWIRTLPLHSLIEMNSNKYILSSNGSYKFENLKRNFYELNITLLPIYPRVLLIPQLAPFVELIHRQPIKVIDQRLTWGPSSEVHYSDPYDAGSAYRVWIPRNFSSVRNPPPFDSTGTTPHMEDNLRFFLQLPPTSEKFDKLVKEFNQQYPSPFERAIAIEKWFRKSFTYTKSETQKIPANTTAIDAFLFQWKKGNCEYFATAMVLMLRAGGIPARFVAGFLGGQWNRIGNYLMIREGDAHSWVEAYFHDRGWLIFDPTPAITSTEIAHSRLFLSFLQIIDIISLAWHKHVIAYDLSRQSQYFKIGTLSLLRWYNGIKNIKKETTKFDFRKVHYKRIFLVMMILLLWIIYYSTTKYKALILPDVQHPLSVSAKKATSLISILDRKLELIGCQRPLSRPPLLHSRLISALIKKPQELSEIVTRYNEIRFGGKTITQEEYKTLIQKIKLIE